MITLNNEYLRKKYESKEIASIKDIDLSFSNINDVAPGEDIFQGFTSLERLDLGNNYLEEINAQLFESLSSLKELKLDKNKLRIIHPDAFKNLKNLERLEICSNDLTCIHPSTFESLSNLKHLDLHLNRLTVIESNLFKGLFKVEFLSVRNNELEEIKGNAFEDLLSIKYLHIHNNKIRKVDSFKGLANLLKLQIMDNKLGRLNPSLFNEFLNIREIFLCNDAIEVLEADAFKSMMKLEKLFLKKNKISHIDVNAFSNLNSLKYLQLNNNNLKRVDPLCFSRLKSIDLILLYENDPDYCLMSYYNEATSFVLMKNEAMKLKEHGYIANWIDFLQNLSKFTIKDPLINKLINDRYVVKKKLGNGSFGTVYLIYDTKNGENKAMKIIDGRDLTASNERNFLWRTNHENIIRFFDFFEMRISMSFNICLITEYCQNGDLKQTIKKAKQMNRIFTDEEITNWMIQTTNGLKYIHSNSIIHRDIKPENMLLDKNNVIKIADLGTAKFVESSDGTSWVGTLNYISPEVFESLFRSTIYSAKTDIWSLGCVLYELIHLIEAFPLGLKDDPPIPSFEYSRIFSTILTKMLVKDPENRIDSNSLYDEFINLEKQIKNQ